MMIITNLSRSSSSLRENSKKYREVDSYGGKKYRGASTRGRSSKASSRGFRGRSSSVDRRDESPHDDRDDKSKQGGKEKNKKSKFFSPQS